MLKTKIAVLSVVLLTAFTGSFAADSSPFHFLRYQSGARAAGLSGSFVAIENDASALMYNPATIRTVEDHNFQTTFFKHIMDINSGSVSYVRDSVWDGTIAGAVTYTNYGSFDYLDDLGSSQGGSFSANDFALGLTYANDLDTNISYGVTAKFIFVNLEKASSSALAIDAGLLYHFSDNRTNIGLSILHAGYQLSEIYDREENLPVDIRAGFNHRLRGLPVLFNLTFHHLGDKYDSFFQRFENIAVGAEIYLGKYIMARVGYDNAIRQMSSPTNDKKMSGFSGGLGLRLEQFDLNYSLSKVGADMTLHRFSVAFNLYQ